MTNPIIKADEKQQIRELKALCIRTAEALAEAYGLIDELREQLEMKNENCTAE